MKEGGWRLFGAGLVVPWCCIGPVALSLAGVTGLSFGVLITIEATLFPYLAIIAVALLGRAHYLLHFKHQGNRLSRVITWASTGLVGVMLVIQLGGWD